MTRRDVASGPGGVDLTNCDREPIHIPGRIQSFGALLAVGDDWQIVHASANLQEMLGIGSADVVGRQLNSVLDRQAVHDLRSRLQVLVSDDAVERIFAIALTGRADRLFDVALHRSPTAIVIEIEVHVETHQDHISNIRPMVDRIRDADGVDDLCQKAARVMKGLTGFDRVMVYRFDPDGSGEVVAEVKEGDLESFLGLHYPASDIPRQARELYKRNLLRIISDVDDPGIPVEPALNDRGEPLDLSLSTTRAVSPVHIEYLRNMGVGASMSVSILKRGELWGLFACHHYSARILPYSVRTAAELFGQFFAFLVDEKETDLERAEAERAKGLHDRLMMRLAEGGSLSRDFDTITEDISRVIQFDGVVGWLDGEYFSRGSTPSREQFAGLSGFLDQRVDRKVFVTDCLSEHHPEAAAFAREAAGVLVLPVSRAPRDYIAFFREEYAQSVNWAGDPQKPYDTGPLGDRLTPRKSFELWQEVVRGRCRPWTQGDLRAAESLRLTILEIILRITDEAVQERGRSQERQELLIAELNHRVRNILNLIRSLIAESSSEAQDIDAFTQMVGGRIHALARAHDQITRENWSPASLYELLRTETGAYLGDGTDRVIITGPDAMIHPKAFSTLSLVFHEMITNSVKYGALCDSSGVIEVTLCEGRGGSLTVEWRERGGPPVQAPSRKGFGTTIIERSIPYELQGEAKVTFSLSGLLASFKVPARFVSAFTQAQEQAPSRETEAVPKRAISGRVLVVEDNMIIAMEAEDILRDLGAADVRIAGNVADALRHLDEAMPDFALLDVNLGDENSERVAQRLADAGVPFAFATGYGDVAGLTSEFADTPVLQKPYTKRDLAGVLAGQG